MSEPTVGTAKEQSTKLRFRGVRRERLYETVLTQLIEHIVTGQIMAGQRLPSEQELERQMGVSRHVLRQAFSVLESTGLIESRPGRGRFVRRFNSSDLARFPFWKAAARTTGEGRL